MKNSFDANVSRRRPKTTKNKASSADFVASVTTDLDQPPETTSDLSESNDEQQDGDQLKDVDQLSPAQQLKAHIKSRKQARQSTTTQKKPTARMDEADSKERINRLKMRLQASLPLEAASEQGPWETAQATKRIVEGLTKQMQALREENQTLENSLQLTKEKIREQDEYLQTVEANHAQAKTKAEEMAQLSEELMEEVELVATERDQAMARLVDRMNVIVQQEQKLAQNQEMLLAEKQRSQHLTLKNQELELLLQSRDDQIESLETQLARRTAQRDSVMQQIKEMESQTAQYAESKQALEEIQRMIQAAQSQ